MHQREFDEACLSLRSYWGSRPAAPPDAAVVLVDLCHDWPEYLVQALLTARVLGEVLQAPLVAITGTTRVVKRSAPSWNLETVRKWAGAFGINDVRLLPDLERSDLKAATRALDGEWEVAANDSATLIESDRSADAGQHMRRQCIYESTLRTELRPSVDIADFALLCNALEVELVDEWLRNLLGGRAVRAVVTGHIDYNPWRLLASRALNSGD